MLNKNVLIVEDDPSVRKLLQISLQAAGCSVTTASTGVEAMKMLSTSHPDIVVTDWMMPEMDGQELCAQIRQLNPIKYIYVILMTAHSDVVDLVDALRAGADEYITKPIDARELIARIHAASRFLEVERELRMHTAVDSLTHMLNRGTLMEILSHEYAKFLRYDEPLSLAMVEIDSFKSVNDQYGHSAGDAVLKSVSHVVMEQIRSSDYAGRYGGDEFCILLPNTELASAGICAERIRAQIALTPIITDGGTANITVSIGVVQADLTTRTDVKLVNRAEQSLLLAKQAGGNHVGLPLTDCASNDPTDILESFLQRR